MVVLGSRRFLMGDLLAARPLQVAPRHLFGFVESSSDCFKEDHKLKNLKDLKDWMCA